MAKVLLGSFQTVKEVDVGISTLLLHYTEEEFYLPTPREVLEIFILAWLY